MVQVTNGASYIFITQRYPNQVEKAIFLQEVFWYPIIFVFFLKKLGTKKPLVKKLLLDLIRVALGDENGASSVRNPNILGCQISLPEVFWYPIILV